MTALKIQPGRTATYGDVSLQWDLAPSFFKVDDGFLSALMCRATDRRDGCKAFDLAAVINTDGIGYSYRHLHGTETLEPVQVLDAIDQVHAELQAMTRYKEREGRGLAW